ncbi:MAG: hypothetical protein KA436_01685, partial [Oligoflexales bacterium]|nr:hypothetical protein [Oligoflexales bacterium]
RNHAWTFLDSVMELNSSHIPIQPSLGKNQEYRNIAVFVKAGLKMGQWGVNLGEITGVKPMKSGGGQTT